MQKKALKSCIAVIVLMLATSILALINVISVNQMVGIEDSERLPNMLRLLESYLFVELIFVLTATAAACYFFRNIFSYSNGFQHENHISSTDDLVSRLQQELDNQNCLINSLKERHRSLIEYDNIRTEFFSSMSHELKTPISVILGAVQLIDQLPQDIEGSKAIKHFHTIKQNCYRLLRLINNILDTTRLEKGYITTNLENSNIVYLVEEMTQSVVPFAEQKGLSLIFDTEKEEIITAVDIDKIERIMLNLLSNAIKFTPSGGNVFVTLSSKNDMVIISVRDTGPGIPVYMQQKIFERYRQVNSTLTREAEGSGIGLSLVKAFVELHGGTIGVISEEGKGSEFIIELPIKQCESSSLVENCSTHQQSKIVQAINIEFSDIYTKAS